MAKAKLKSGGRVALVSSLGRERIVKPRINWKKVDATTEKDISRHKAADEREARAASAAYARRVRTRTKLTQAEFAKRIGVPLETVRNWEQGKRCPQGPARALLRVIDKAPEIAFSVLDQHRATPSSPKAARVRAKSGGRYDEAKRGKGVSSALGPTKVHLGPDGRIVVPAAFREALGIKEGDPLFASIKDGELHLLTVRAAVRKAQTLVRQFVPEGVSLVDDLLDDRRLEFDQEQTNG